jgi:3-oxoacyl-[acyl-carrier-protein] synthase II
MSSKKRIVITGIGPLCSIGSGKKEVLSALMAGKTQVLKHACTYGKDIWEYFYVHKLTNFKIDNYVSDKGLLQWIDDWKENQRDIDYELLAATTSLAIQDSGFDISSCPQEVGLMMVHENPGLEPLIDHLTNKTLEAVQRRVFEKKELLPLEIRKEVTEASQRLGYDTQTFMHLFFIAKLFGVQGFSLFMNNACSSGLYAMESAAQHIRSGRLRAAIVVGADYPDFVYKYLWFKKLKIYAEDGLVKPFDEQANGIVFGEGGGGLVLEEYESAKKRGARIYCEYRGGGFNLEGMKISFPSIGSDLYQRAAQEALSEAGSSHADIDLMIPHGVAERVTDKHEVRSLLPILKEGRSVVTAYKPYVGHNLGSSALLELCLICMCMESSFVPPLLNTNQIDPNLEPWIARKVSEKRISTVLKTSCGFAGYNAAVVLTNPRIN